MGDAATGDDPFDFHGRARAAFAQGDYRNATYLAAHATVDEPRNPKTHLLYSLGMFAMGEYRGAAMESHAVVALGKTPDWPTVYEFYGNVEPYTTQLRALEKYVHDNPSSPEGRFLLGFHYLMDGHPNEAKDELLKALKLAPRDRLAAQLLKEAGGTVPRGNRQAVVGVAASGDAQAGVAGAAGPAARAEEIAASHGGPREPDAAGSFSSFPSPRRLFSCRKCRPRFGFFCGCQGSNVAATSPNDGSSAWLVAGEND